MGVGERRGGRRAGGRRRANHRRNHRNNRHNRRRRRHHGGGAIFAVRWGNRTGTAGTSGETGAAVTPRSYPLLVIFSVIAFVGICMGMTMLTVGGWNDSSVGIAGIVILSISSLIAVIVGVMRCHLMKKYQTSDAQEHAGELEAGTVNPNMIASNETLEGEGATVSQANETTSYIVQTGAPPSVGVAMGTQPGYPLGPAQPYPPYATNYLGAAYPPNPAQPSNVGVVDPPSEGESVPPPPSYDDVIAGNV
ncbi:uncharacterized protein LOC105441002 isoform X2 [Strongylocentrotus purpuratus]|uniref:Uncharacterized protein n=1 Tax=Strongylocentrotus purpuratus TaxID=7668 RepID=A0A7M7PSN3_STRPU|nr:uncharacterized protein LOC105441002 isoform X2 [Strongylocentrotus purpuratus]